MRALGVRRVVAAGAVAALVLPGSPVWGAVAQEPPPAEVPGPPDLGADTGSGGHSEAVAPPPPPPELAALDAAVARLSAAEAALARREGASARAEYAVRVAEKAVVPHLGAVRRAIEAVEVARVAAAEAAELTAVALGAVAVADGRLQDRAVDAYKYGIGHRGSLTLGAIRSADGPLAMARNLRDLESVFGHAHATYVETVAVAHRTHLGQRDAERALLRAERDLPSRRVELLAAERRVAERRAAAAAAEQRWITAARAVDAARGRHESAIAAVAALPPPPVGPLSPGGTPPDGATAAVVEVGQPAVSSPPDAGADDAIPDLGDVDLIGRRQRALDKARSLTDDQRRSRYDLVCPVAGSATFDDDWHYPRSDLRRHEGTDLFAVRGTEVVTVLAATIAAIDPVDVGGDDLGGISVSYVSQDGSRWYAAHLASVAEGLAVGQEVPAGTPIGTVGTSGNARGTPPHLHLGWYVRGVAVNPYASLASVCSA